ILALLLALIGFYAHMSYEELSQREVIDLYGAATSMWQMIQTQKGDTVSLRIQNPNFEHDGWQSSHTVISLVSKDLPFLVDSLSAELIRQGCVVECLNYCGNILLAKDASGKVVQCSVAQEEQNITEIATLMIEVSRKEPGEFKKIELGLKAVFSEIQVSVADWRPMLAVLNQCVVALEKNNSARQSDIFEESISFLNWSAQNMVFLGYAYYKITGKGDNRTSVIQDQSNLGVLKYHEVASPYEYDDLTDEGKILIANTTQCVLLGKSTTISKVHRPDYYDFLLIKDLSQSGEVVGEHLFFGLFSSSAYTMRPSTIPCVRMKVNNIIARDGVAVNSHRGKKLLHILETLPRSDLLYGTEDDLYRWVSGINNLQERLNVRLFLRKDTFGTYYSCLVYVPREKFSSQLRFAIQTILKDTLSGVDVEFSPRFSNSVLARIHYLIRIKPGVPSESIDLDELERHVAAAALTWEEALRHALFEHYGEQQADVLYKKYGEAFPAGYREDFIARTAVFDIDNVEKMDEIDALGMSFYKPLEGIDGALRFKLFQPACAIPLSEVVPMLENFGLTVESERPYEIHPLNEKSVWINDFSLTYRTIADMDIEAVRADFQEAFFNVWNGHAESDGYNRLVLSAGLNWRQVSMFRAYGKYLWQVGFTFSQNYIERSLYDNPGIARNLAQLFELRFNPEFDLDRNVSEQSVLKEINALLEGVSSLDQDRILRRFMSVILATLRTNYYQLDAEGNSKSYVSFKLNPSEIPEMPLPLPAYEIWVYSPRVEGIHLRSGVKGRKVVARGGIRWSDRREDFRTEVLGLMKAQQVKNS
ncbi:MAG: NAD-glutamate dehydrogenase domain-containing protein, partial [Pseudomonadota bacterium]